MHTFFQNHFLKYSKNGNHGQLSAQLPVQKEKALKRIRFKAFLMVMKVLAAGPPAGIKQRNQ